MHFSYILTNMILEMLRVKLRQGLVPFVLSIGVLATLDPVSSGQFAGIGASPQKGSEWNEGQREVAEWFEDGAEGTNEEGAESLEEFEQNELQKEFLCLTDIFNCGIYEQAKEELNQRDFSSALEEMQEVGLLGSPAALAGAEAWGSSSPLPPIF